jgi:E3 ubiquitin-protein ligase SHPRH
VVCELTSSNRSSRSVSWRAPNHYCRKLIRSLGQKEETTVYCYSTQDTVESRILSQGVRNGSSIYLKEEEQGDQVVEDMDNVVGAAHKGGDIGVDGNEEEMLKLIML